MDSITVVKDEKSFLDLRIGSNAGTLVTWEGTDEVWYRLVNLNLVRDCTEDLPLIKGRRYGHTYKPVITVVTLVLGDEYKRITSPGVTTKMEYCNSKGYRFVVGGEEYWDKSRPLAWSKIIVLRKVLEEGKDHFLFWTDADAVITNPEVYLETLLKEMPLSTDIMPTRDGAGNINTGHFFLRNTSWSLQLLDRIYARTHCLNHPWWENQAFIELYESDPSVKRKTLLQTNSKLFNSYIDMSQPYTEGDFLIHFAGTKDRKRLEFLMKTFADPTERKSYMKQEENEQVFRRVLGFRSESKWVEVSRELTRIKVDTCTPAQLLRFYEESMLSSWYQPVGQKSDSKKEFNRFGYLMVDLLASGKVDEEWKCNRDRLKGNLSFLEPRNQREEVVTATSTFEEVRNGLKVEAGVKYLIRCPDFDSNSYWSLPCFNPQMVEEGKP